MPKIKDSEHGTTYGYRKGCRCEPCREAKRIDWQEYKARQATQAIEDFEGMPDEQDQIAAILETLVLRVRCDCGEWHDASPEFQCPNGALVPDFPDPEVQ